MLLAFHVENRRTMIGLFDWAPSAEADDPGTASPVRPLVASWVVRTVEHRTADEWSVLVTGLLESVASAYDVDGLAISSTVPAVLAEMRAMAELTFTNARCVVVGTGMKTGLPVLTDNPRETGTDRIANAVAVVQRRLAPAIVVDCGTATTFDVVDAGSRFVGGAIAPGVEIAVEALAAGGAQLRRVELHPPRALVAKNTIEALQSGAVYGFVAQVDGMVARLRDELGLDNQTATVVTGAFAELVVDHGTTPVIHLPMLTLEGVAAIFDRNP
jgi:type III pantothenate kinase